ncbi:MAG: response regulator transcription factor [Marinifilaceae bacterium]
MGIKGFNAFQNYISDIENSYYLQLEAFITILEGMARITNDCVYLVDFYKGEVPYISNNPLFLCGMTPAEVQKMGIEFSKTYTPHTDNKMTVELISSWFEFMNNKHLSEKCDYTLSYHYFLQDKLVNAAMTPVFLSKDGKPWLMLCSSKLSTEQTSGNAVIFKMNSKQLWKYSFEAKRWLEDEMIQLNEIEIELLRLAIQGKNENEISDLLFRSKDGVKSIKRRIFKKLDVSNITEAVSYAISHGII